MHKSKKFYVDLFGPEFVQMSPSPKLNLIQIPSAE